MGYDFEMPTIDRYEGTFTEQQIQRQQREDQRTQQLTQAQFGVYQGFTGLGMMPNQIDMSPFEDMTIGELSVVGQQQQYGTTLQGLLPSTGMSRQRAQAYGQMWPNLDPRDARMYQGMTSGDQMSWAKMAQRQPDEFQQLVGMGTLPGAAGSTIDMSMMGMVDYRETEGGGRQITGMQWGTSSLANATLSSAAMAQQVWGADYGGRGDVSQGLIGAMVEGGSFGGQIWQMQEQAKYQQAMSGIQMQQLQMQKAFQTGVGIGDYAGVTNPQTGQPFGFNTGRFNVDVKGVGGFQTAGGGMWGAQDALRGMNYMQQEWGFGRQREQMEMQDRFWGQNYDLNKRGAMMQRPWKREDWAYQDQTRALQWGWKQEDFQEEARFMTGRDRRLAERGMARETIMYGMEGEQIDKGRERQEDLWRLEDERFMIQEAQHREAVEFQEEGIKIQERFFEERKRLELEQQAMQRAMQMEQMRLQEKQIAASAAYAKSQQEIAMTMAEFSQFSTEMMAQGSLFNEDTLAGLLELFGEISPAFAKMLQDWIDQLNAASGGGRSQEPDGGEDNWEDEEEDDVPKVPVAPGDDDYDPDDPAAPRLHGGRLLAGQEGLVGEAGTEVFKPYFTGDVIPSYKTEPWMNTMVAGNVSGDGGKVIHLVVNLGDQHFKEYILDTVDQEVDV